MTQTLRRDRDASLARLNYEAAAFRFRMAMLDFDAVLAAEEVKDNPNHDPATGRFTSGGGVGGGRLPAKVGRLSLNKGFSSPVCRK